MKNEKLFYFDAVFGRSNLTITSNVDFTALTYRRHKPFEHGGLYTSKVTRSDVGRLKDAGFIQVNNYNDLLK